ncbi:hypothetical protein [Novacetimonas pomaceti]|uniref:hypothetical protein n=1 Tax=Novacetimonas pomaceti TaxID=2021998 RepID=UPI001C2D5308|nr:hypothetical protein [Novacetimonas pomaceti]MBV1833046.1 hypothetical protein [Novacetimonas pomaceti]
MALTSDAAEPVNIPDADQPYDWPIWLDKVGTIADSHGITYLSAVHIKALRLAWGGRRDAARCVSARDWG